MTRQEEIQYIKENIRIEELADKFGLTEIGRSPRAIRYKSLSDSSYELVVFKDSNRFIDYGAGGLSGSVIDFYIHITGKDYIEAIKELRELSGIKGHEEPIKFNRNDFRLAEREFQELLRVYISNCKNKTKYLLELREFIRDMKNRIAKEELNLTDLA